MKKSDQTADAATHSAPNKEVIIGELMTLAEPLRTGHRGPFNKLQLRLDQSADDRPFEPPVIREAEAAPMVAAFAERLEAVRQADPAIFNFFRARLKRGLENIESGRAVSLVPPADAHPAHQKYFVSLLRDQRLEPPALIEAGKFYGLNRITAPHGNGGAGWCVWFEDDSGGAFGHGRDASGLTFWRRPGEKTEAENTRFRKNVDTAHAALLADQMARRR